MISWMSVCNSSMVGVCCGNEYNLFKRYNKKLRMRAE